MKQTQAITISKHNEKPELEHLFRECLETVRKEIMLRRPKQEDQEFEESLMKLAESQKKPVTFTVKDKYNLLDLFVNNQKVLTNIYNQLFQPQ